MLPDNTRDVLLFLFPGADETSDWKLVADPIAIESWNREEPRPTDREINDAANDRIEVNGQLFSAWYAEHGGDPLLTCRHQAKRLVATNHVLRTVLRAMAVVIQRELRAIKDGKPRPNATIDELERELVEVIDGGEAD